MRLSPQSIEALWDIHARHVAAHGCAEQIIVHDDIPAGHGRFEWMGPACAEAKILARIAIDAEAPSWLSATRSELVDLLSAEPR